MSIQNEPGRGIRYVHGARISNLFAADYELSFSQWVLVRKVRERMNVNVFRSLLI